MFILIALEVHSALLIGPDSFYYWVIFFLVIESDSVKIILNGGEASSSIYKVIQTVELICRFI